MPRKAEIQAEEAVVSSPLRRSSRRTSVNSPAPATLGTRRNSQTQNENAEVKAPKTRRASLSQENSEKAEAKPATKGRRASTSKEESEPKPEPAKARGRRSSASTEPTPEEAPKPQTVTRRRRSSAAEDPPNPEAVKPVRTRRGSSADKPVEDETAKKITRARRNLAKDEEPKEEPVTRTTRSRRLSVDKAEESELNAKKPVGRGRRSSTEVLESEPEPKVVKLASTKSRRRPSITENVAGLESIEELDSEIKSRHSSSPILKEATINLNRIKHDKPEPTKENLNLSVIDESSFTEELQINTLEGQEETPRRSPRLNKVKSAEKLDKKSSPKSEKGKNMDTTQEQEKEDLIKDEEGTEEKRNEETSPKTAELNSNPEKEKPDEEEAPLEVVAPETNELEKSEEVSELLNEKSSQEDNVSKSSSNEDNVGKKLRETDNCNISIGSDGSFSFHLNMSLATTRNDGTENEDLNSSKSSNTSDKENVNTNVVSTPAPKKVITEEKEIVLSTLTNNVTAENKNIFQQEVVVARVSNVFRPRMKENSFLEPMEVDDYSTLEENSEELKTEDLVKDAEIKEKPINKNLLKEARVDLENNSANESFHLHLSNYGDNQDPNEEEVKDEFVDDTTKEVSGDEESKLVIEGIEKSNSKDSHVIAAVEQETEKIKEIRSPVKNSEIAEQVTELEPDIQLKTDVDKTEVEENLKEHNSEELKAQMLSPKHTSQEQRCSISEEKTEKLEINTHKDDTPKSVKQDNKEISRESKSPQCLDSPTSKNDTKIPSRVRSPSFICVKMEDNKDQSTSPKLVPRRSKSPQVEKAEKIKEDTMRRSESPMLTNQDIEEQNTKKTPEKIFSETFENSEKVDECVLSIEVIEQEKTTTENTLDSSVKEGAIDEPVDDTFWSNSLNSENSDTAALTISAVEKAVRRSYTGLEEKCDIAQPCEDMSETADESEEETISVDNAKTETSTIGCQVNNDVKSPTEQSEELKPELEHSLPKSVESEPQKLGTTDDYDFHIPSDEEAEETHAPEYDQSTVVNSFMASSQLLADDSSTVEIQTVILAETTLTEEDTGVKEKVSLTKTTLTEEDTGVKEKVSQSSLNDETDDFVDEIQDHEEKVADEKPLSPNPKKKSISKNNEESDQEVDEYVGKSPSPTPKKKSKKRISKGKNSKDSKTNISENEDDSPKKKCKNKLSEDSNELEDTAMKSPQKKLRIRKYFVGKEIDSCEENLDITHEEKDDIEDSETERKIPKKKKIKRRSVIKHDILSDVENIDTSTDVNNADIEVDDEHPRDKSRFSQTRKSNENIEGIKKRKRKRPSKRNSECTEEAEVSKKKVKRSKKKPLKNSATSEGSSDEETILNSASLLRKEKKQHRNTEDSKEISPSSKLDDFLSKKLEELRSEEESSSAGDNDEEPNEFVCTMAEEGEEDTPSEDSNAIIDEGESINTTESEYDFHDDDYDENDSFICDEEEDQLLSGEEYDLGNEKKKKKKSRIIQLDNSDDDIIRIQRKEKTTPVTKKKSRIISVSDSSESEENKEPDPHEIINPTESETEKSEFVEENTEEEVFVVKSKHGVGSLETSLNASTCQSPGPHRTTEKRRLSSITIQENINVKEMKEVPLSGRISQIVDTFCTTMHKGEISMNLSIECLVKEDETSADETNLKKSQASASSSIEVFECEENMDSEEGTSHKPPRRLSASMDNIESSELKNKARKKRKLSKSMDHLDQIETKSKKKKLRRKKKKNVEKNKEKTKISAEEELRVRSFGLINQLLTDLKNRPKRMMKPSTKMNNSWITEVVDVKPSTSAFDKHEQAAYRAGKVHPKDFRTQMLNDPSRVRRMETKMLLKKKGVYK